MATSSESKITSVCRCGAQLRVPAKAVGKRVTCPKCSYQYIVTEPLKTDKYDALSELAAMESKAELMISTLQPIKDAEQLKQIANCPNCYAKLAPDSVLCTNCGFHLTKGKLLKTAAASGAAGPAKPSGGAGLPSIPLSSVGGFLGRQAMGMAVSGLGAGIGGLIWAGIAIYLHFEIGYVAILVGILAGFGIYKFTHNHNVVTGLMAVAFAAFGLLLGKVAIAMYFEAEVASVFKQIISKDYDQMSPEERHDTLLDIVADDLYREDHPQADAEELTDDDDDDAGDQYRAEAEEIVAKMSEDEKRRRVQSFVQEANRSIDEASHFSLVERVKLTSSPWDILWMLLAFGAAFKLGCGGPDTE